MRDAFVAAMGAAVTGVTVVTTDGAGGRFGLTVSAMASVSADPPMLLVCVNRRSPLEPALRRNAAFAVNVLGEDQSGVADTFAGRAGAGEPYAFEPACWRAGAFGLPLLAGATAGFACRLASAVPAGSHSIVIGEVVAASRGDAPALAYARRGYARPAPLR